MGRLVRVITYKSAFLSHRSIATTATYLARMDGEEDKGWEGVAAALGGNDVKGVEESLRHSCWMYRICIWCWFGAAVKQLCGSAFLNLHPVPQHYSLWRCPCCPDLGPVCTWPTRCLDWGKGTLQTLSSVLINRKGGQNDRLNYRAVPVMFSRHVMLPMAHGVTLPRVIMHMDSQIFGGIMAAYTIATTLLKTLTLGNLSSTNSNL